MTRSITTLLEQRDALDEQQRARFDALYDVAVVTGRLDPPAPMEPWLTERFGGADAVRTQRIVKVTNRWTREGALFNELRARRPIPSATPDPQPVGACDLCDPANRTTADTFGRITGDHSITASNVAKYDGQHGIVIFGSHDAPGWDEDQVVDAFATARRWLAAANTATADAIYPFVVWNHGARSGASIAHPHLQVLLAEDGPYARVGVWREAAAAYHRQTGRRFIDDLVDAHDALGLAGGTGLRWLAHLTPVKERETLIVARALDDDLARTIHAVLRVMLEDLGVTAFNVACYLRPLGPTHEDWSELPAIARIVDRGDIARATSDIGAMELYAQPVISTDPFTVAEALRARLG